MGTRGRSKDDATTSPLTSTNRTLASTTSTLLTVRLNATAGYLVTVLCRVGTLTCGCVLADYNLVHNRDVWLNAIDVRGELGVADLLSLYVLNLILGHVVSLLA
jgi:hypothetical protein